MSVEVESAILLAWAPEFSYISFRGAIRFARFTLAHDPVMGDDGDSAPLSEDEESFLRFLFKERGWIFISIACGRSAAHRAVFLLALHASNFADARRVVQQKPALLPAPSATMVIGVTIVLP